MPILPQLYFSHLQQQRESPFLWEKVSRQVRPLYWKELGSRINMLVRGMDAIGITPQHRVAVFTEKPLNSFFAHLSALILGTVSVCFARNCPLDERISSLREAGVKLVFVDSLEHAEILLEHKDRLPQVSHVIIMEAIGTARSEGLTLMTFLELMERGKSQPDRTAAMIRAIQPTDRAVLMYSIMDRWARATMLTHEDIQDRFAQLQRLIQPTQITKDDVLLIASSFHESPLHFAACMLPLLHGAQASYGEAGPLEELQLISVNPTVIVGESPFFHQLKEEALHSAQAAGKVDDFVMRQALKIGKARYERPTRLSLGEKLTDKLLHTLIIQKFRQRMGGRLHAAISTDSHLNYDAQLFFYSFGVEVFEIDSGV
jgi:long-chain acyl-CoA synthetase